jgi:DNA polymerase-3 subunit beta
MTDDESKRVDLSFEAGKVVMKARGAETGSSEVVMTLPEYDGAPVTIAFDPQYVVEFLRAIDGEPSVLLEMSDGGKPALFQCGDNYKYLVMPLAG